MTTRNDREKLGKILSQTRLFKDLDKQVISHLAQVSYSHTIPKGSVIYFTDERANSLYIIRHGLIFIILASVDGREMIINEIHEGECFGELAMITGLPHSTSAVAQVESEVIIVPGENLLTTMKSNSRLMESMLNVIAERLRLSNQRESALAFLDAPARLARILRILNEQIDDLGYISISQADLARRTGLTRQTVAKNLSRWRRAGWLLTGRGRIVLLNLEELIKIEYQAIG
jgi:CRP/FNR family cyclic AMP-dependent transcriptional regulator